MQRLLGVLGGLVALVALSSMATANAAEFGLASPGEISPTPLHPTLVAVAIGQLKESDGSIAIVDLRAGERGGRVGGALRVYSPMEGYYNGRVWTFAVEDGVVRVSGGGLLIRPDGTHGRVRFEATFSPDDRKATMIVRGRDGDEYTLSGQLEPGLIWAGDPQRLAERES